MTYGDRDFEDDYDDGRKPLRNDTVTFEKCKVLRETNAALLVRMDDGSEVWFPKSQIHDDSEVYKAGTDGKLVVTAWIAEQKGLV